jgi:gliding motility-associated-like protein
MTTLKFHTMNSQALWKISKLPFILSLFLFLFSSPWANATHIAGGELSYRCLGNDLYEVTLQVRRDCANANAEALFDNPAAVWVYDGDFGQLPNFANKGRFLFYLNESDTLERTETNPCLDFTGGLCVETALYKDTIQLPRRPGGYYLMYQRCCRNSIINNIQNPLETGSSYLLRISEAALETCSSSPQLTEFPPLSTCINEPFAFDQSAEVINPGDSVVYSLYTPYQGATIDNPNPDVTGIIPGFPDRVQWLTPTYDEAYMLGNQADPLTIDPETGLLTGLPQIQGTFLIGIQVQQYRSGVLISSVIRDFQITVGDCGGLPEADFEPSGVFCDGLNVSFDNLSQNAAFSTWIFDVDNPSDQSNAFEPSYTYPDTGSYEVMLIVSNDSVCFDTIQKELILRESALNVDFEVSLSECLDSFVINLTDLSNDTVGGIGNREWRIETLDSIYFFSEPNPELILNQEQTIEVTLVIDPANGCPGDTLSRTYDLNFIDLDLIGDSISICLGESTNLLNTFDPDLNYSWLPDQFLSPNNTVPNPTATPDSSLTYFVSATDGLCTADDSVFVGVRSGQIEIIDLSDDDCANDRTLTVEGISVDSIRWSNDPNFFNILGTSDTLSISIEEETRIYVDVINDSLDCPLRDSIDLFYRGINIAYPDTLELCIGDTVSFTLRNLNVGDTLSVSWMDNPIIIGGQDDITVILFKEELEDDLLIFTAVNQFGCELTDTMYVQAIEGKESDFEFERTCGSLTVDFINLQDGDMWLWDFGDGNESNENSPTHTYEEPGMYAVTLTFTGACSSRTTKTININLIETDFPEDLEVCPGQSVFLNPNGDTTYTYSWSPAGPLDDANAVNPLATVEETTTFSVTISEPSDTCTIEETVTVTVVDPFEVSVSDPLICAGDTVALTATTLNPDLDLNYSWSPTEFILTDPNQASISVTVDETTVFSVTGVDSFGCEVTKTVTVNVETLGPNVIATATPQTINFGDDSQLNVEGGSNNWTYRWEPEEFLDNPNIRDPLATPRDTTVFTVTITTENGCKFEDTVRVNVDRPACEPPFVFLPNAFSPNGDGSNDVLFVRGEFVDRVELMIYNRWGEKVFETRDQSIGWDGTFNGKELEPGVFGYYLFVTCEGGGEHQQQGSINLIR